ncbi:MAG: AAA family ATPase [Bacteriovoracia bacterium]
MEKNHEQNKDKEDLKVDECNGPEDFQKEIEEIMRERFGDDIQVITKEINPLLKPGKGKNTKENYSKKQTSAQDVINNFSYNPKDIKEYLDRYIVKQDEAKKSLSIAVCDHYNHVSSMLQSETIDSDEFYSKQNVLLLGPTGVGKTFIVKMIAKLIGVPFVKADATRFTETGYVGANVDDLVRDLVAMAGGDIELAQYGIIFFDEADKIAGSSNHFGKDISGRGVQYALLKLMEETEIDLRSSTDMTSQLQAFMDFQTKGEISKKVINTKNILFIVSGAFTGLEDIVKRRLKAGAIGLKENILKKQLSNTNFSALASSKDFIDLGFEPEFIGRLPVRVSCMPLKIDDLFQILKYSKSSIINQYVGAFESYGIELEFTDKALRKIAELAHKEKTGARALMTVCERVLRDFKFELPSTNIDRLTVTEELVENPEGYLIWLLSQYN